MKIRIKLVWMFTAAALLLAGCAAPAAEAPAAGASYDYASQETASAPEEAPAAEPMEPGLDGGVYADSNGSAQPQYGNHKIITDYIIEMETDEFDLHIEMLQSKAAELGGYVQHSSVNGSKPATYRDPGRYAFFSFRIPSDRAGEFVEYTKGTGVITHSNVDTRDVTLEYFDSETRLEVLRTQLDRLTSILVETDNLADIIALEQEIARVTLEIEQLTTELRRYDDLIDFTTVDVSVNENQLAMAPADELTMGQRISKGFSENLHSLGIFLEDAIVWLVTSLPAILTIAAVAFTAVWLAKRITRGRDKSRARRAEKRAEAQRKMSEVAAKNGSKEGNDGNKD